MHAATHGAPPWAPAGHPPGHSRGDRHERLSGTGAITLAPVPQRLGLYVSLLPWHVTGDDVFTFVQQLRRPLTRPRPVLWDRVSGHKTAARLLRDIDGHWVHVACLPAYAPALNVVDHAWGHTQYGEMATFIPQDVNDLAQAVATSRIATHGRQELLNAFFQHARLVL